MNALKIWATRHAQTAIGTLGRLAEQRLPSAFVILVIGIALALPACLQVVLTNARLASGDWNRAVEISVFFKIDATIASAEQTAVALRKRVDIESIRIVSAEAGLTEFRNQSGFGEALNALTDNPLPHTLIVRPRPEAARGAALVELADALRQVPQVEQVQLDSEWVERFNAMLAILTRATTVIGLLLAIGVIVIVGNAIRADIQARRDEIEVTKLVGGSDAFVRRPFLYTGLWFGLAGGIFALLVTFGVVALLGGPVNHLAQLYGSSFELAGLGFTNSLLTLGVGLALGWIGSFIAATRHLRAIEPT